MDIIGIGFWEVLVILVVLIVVVGPKRLPEMARKMGQMTRHFKSMTSEMNRNIQAELRDEEETSKSNDYSTVDNSKNSKDLDRTENG